MLAKQWLSICCAPPGEPAARDRGRRNHEYQNLSLSIQQPLCQLHLIKRQCFFPLYCSNLRNCDLLQWIFGAILGRKWFGLQRFLSVWKIERGEFTNSRSMVIFCKTLVFYLLTSDEPHLGDVKYAGIEQSRPTKWDNCIHCIHT